MDESVFKGRACLGWVCGLFGAGFGFFKPHDRRLLQGSLTLGLAAWAFCFLNYAERAVCLRRLSQRKWDSVGVGREIVRENQSSGADSITVEIDFKQLFANGLMFVPGGFLMAWLKPSFRNGMRIAVSAAGCSPFHRNDSVFHRANCGYRRRADEQSGARWWGSCYSSSASGWFQAFVRMAESLPTSASAVGSEIEKSQKSIHGPTVMSGTEILTENYMNA